jgi:hypothetical protein
MEQRTLKISVLSLCAVLALGLFSRSEATPLLDAADHRVIKQLETVLRERVTSPNNSLKIVVKPTERASEGYFDLIQVQGSPAMLKKLRVSKFNLMARNVHLDTNYLFTERKIRTLKSKTDLTAVVTESDLTYMLAQGKRTKDMGLQVKYLKDRISVSGNLNWTLINGPITGVGRLSMAPGHKVNLNIISMKLRGVEVPQFIKNQFSEHINPVIDYEDLPFNPPFKGVKVEGPKATIYTE